MNQAEGIKMNVHLKIVCCIGLFVALFVSETCSAVSPTNTDQGRVLFEQNWVATNPVVGQDGLGPLFNSTSCAECHHQGGVGGGGRAEFNVHTVGIEAFKITGNQINDDVITRMVRSFHPGFVQSDGKVINTLPLAHRGGTSSYTQAKQNLFSRLPAVFSEVGGPSDSSEVRYASSTPVVFRHRQGRFRMTLRARLFQRNTTALFGAGLIDCIEDREIVKQARIQKSHPEISGRPATLSDGRIGKFGWRGNSATLIEFTDMACANEMGLRTRRKPQPADPMNPNYRNVGFDVTDQQIRSIRDFIASLPAPGRVSVADAPQQSEVVRGEQVFAAIGCAVCHSPNLGPSKGIYSDLLLHDMGFELMDLSRAEPYITRMTPQTRISLSDTESAPVQSGSSGYGGGTTQISTGQIRGPVFEFVAPTSPSELIRVVDIASQDTILRLGDASADDDPGHRVTKGTLTAFVRMKLESTQFNQEWRTPPLWGVRDSAPYMHDGRAETLLEAISVHEGEGSGTRDRFLQLPLTDRRAVIAFLKTLAAPTGNAAM